jgi:hypothetical protein
VDGRRDFPIGDRIIQVPDSPISHDRLQELASSSVRLTEILGQSRGAYPPVVTVAAGPVETVGSDWLVKADASDAVLDEFLSLAVREAADADATGAEPHDVFLGLTRYMPDCVIERGVGEEALEYCLAYLSAGERDFFFGRMSRPDVTSESLRAAHRRISTVALRAGHVYFYYQFLRHNMDALVDECPDDLAEFMLDRRFPVSHVGVHCLILAIKHSSNSEPYIQRWIDWIAEERFDSATSGNATYTMYTFLGDHLGDGRLRALRDAAHSHIVHLLQSPEKVTQARIHLNALVTARYAAADELVTAITNSGLGETTSSQTSSACRWTRCGSCPETRPGKATSSRPCGASSRLKSGPAPSRRHFQCVGDERQPTTHGREPRARRRSTALIHRCRPSAPRTLPHHCCRSFTDKSR